MFGLLDWRWFLLLDLEIPFTYIEIILNLVPDYTSMRDSSETSKTHVLFQ